MKFRTRILCGVLSVLLTCPNMIFAENMTKQVDANAKPEEVVAYVNFGDAVESFGMTATMGDEPYITVGNKMGREGWILNPNNLQKSAYIYFDVDEEVAKDIKDGSSYRVEVDYFDESISSLVLSYDSTTYVKLDDFPLNNDPGGPSKFTPKELEYVEFQDTNTWKTYSWFLENPAMNSRMTNGADFRIGAYGYTMGYSRGETPPVVGAVRLIKTNTKSLINITAETEKAGNIFFEGEKIKFTTHFDNSIYTYQSETFGEYDINIAYTILDSQGDVYKVIEDVANIKPHTVTSKELVFNVDKFDLYTLMIELECQKHKIYSREKTVFSYSKYAGDNLNQRIGIGAPSALNDNPNGREMPKLLADAGFAHVRNNLPYAGSMHGSIKDRNEATNYTWYRQTEADKTKDLLVAGLDLLIYSVHFGNEANVDMGPIDEHTFPYTDAGRENYYKFFDYKIGLYGDSCSVYEIWNEWNGTRNSSSQPVDKCKSYAELCAYLYPKIKEKYPDVTLFGMVPSNVTTGKEGYEWFEGTLKAGAAEYMDGISIHIYQWYGSPLTYNKYEELTNAYELMKKYGYEDKPLWITETGYSSNYEDVNSEEMQAWYNVQSYIIFQEGDLVERIYLHQAMDGYANRMRTEREANFGMFESVPNNSTLVDDGEVTNSAKPFFLGITNMNSLMYDAEYVNKIDFSENTKCYQFKRTNSNKDLIALFSNLQNDSVTLDLGTNKVKVIDFYGNEQEIISNDHKFTFNVNDAVTYVEGDFGRCIPANDGAVRTKDAMITSDYGEEHSVKLINNTGKDLKAKVELLDGSIIDCDTEFDVPSGGKEFTVKTGSTAVKKYEPLHITMYDGDKVYFEGDIIFNMCHKLVLSAETVMNDEGKWCIRASISNMTENIESGTIEFVKPEALASMNKNITVLPNSTETVEFILDDKHSADDLVARLQYVSSKENVAEIVIEKTFNFEYMAKADKAIIIDGDLSEWTKGWIHMDKPENFHQYVGFFTPYSGVNDLSANVAFMYDDEYLYFAGEVIDNVFHAEAVTPLNIWQVDSIQIAMALYPENLQLIGDFEEFAMGLLEGKPVLYRHKTKFETDTPTVIDNSELAITQKDGKTYYEFKAPWKDLIPGFKEIDSKEEILISIVINDNDGEGRKGRMSYGGGIDGTKDYTLFKRVYIGK